MIIGDDSEPRSPMDAKSPTGPPPATPYAGPAPPSYQQSYQTLNQSYQPHTPLQRERISESAGRRFLKALVFALAIWALVGMLTGSFIDRGLDWHRHRHNGSDSDSGERLDPALRAGPQPGDGHAIECLSGYDWVRNEQHPPVEKPYGKWEVTTQYTLPIDADNLYLVSHGVSSLGNVNIVTSDTGADDVVEVQIRAVYDWQSVIEEAEVCLLGRLKKEQGVGIFTPSRWERPNSERYKHSIHWDVTVILPENIVIKKFTTRMHLFSHNLADLKGKVGFKTIDLSSSNLPINVESIAADNLVFHTSNAPIKAGTLDAYSAKLGTSNSPISGGDFYGVDLLEARTSNGPITGVFNTSSKLELRTSNSPIKAEIFVSNNPKGSASSAILRTSNGGIDSSITLASTAKSGAGGKFDLSTHTSNAKLVVSVPSAPVDSIINLDGRTSNAGAAVVLPPAYEGRFFASSSLLGARVNVGKAKDPADKGRQRHVEWSVDKNKRSVTGKAFWEKENEYRGNVDVQTSISAVEISFP